MLTKFIFFTLVLLISTVGYAQPYTVSVLGDSMAHPIGVQLERLSLRDNRRSLIVHRNAIGSSGLAQNNIVNWRTEAQATLTRQNPDIVVIVLGTNDAVGISPYQFGSEGWQRLYTQRVREILDIATRHSRFIYWVGVPPMRNLNFSNKIYQVNQAIIAATRGRSNVVFIDMWERIGRTFSEFYRGQRIRETDGIHYTHAGGRLVAEILAFIIQFQLNLV